ncbi:hypothetical protein F5890DRAFT_1525193 [Lentinula detonsa]|uniref:Uncharacterized protein n=1 Tax=Lentinula detonsa TaxID=2804962 RepID=A0AA38PW79_9AGAR|nr:hypothetical protein F5890DRAFT_1525193 [Lentinula detonsa]
MACYDILADICTDLPFDFFQSQRLDAANPLSFVNDLDNSFNFPLLQSTELPGFTNLPIYQLDFHEELSPNSPVAHLNLEQDAFVFISTDPTNSRGIAKECQINEKSQFDVYPDYLQHKSKAKPSDKRDMLTVDRSNVKIPESDINQAETEHSKTYGHATSASFLEHQLGPTKWNIFTGKLVKRGKASKQQESPSGIIDLLVKTEIIKEALCRFLPPAYSEVDYAVHTWTNGRVLLTRAAVFALSGWSKVFFSYWSRRVERLALFSFHDHRLRIISSELERRLAEDLTDSFNRGTSAYFEPNCYYAHSCCSTDTVVQSFIQITTRRLDAVLKETKERTGFDTTKLRGKSSILDPYLVMKDRFFAISAPKSAPSQAHFGTFESTNDVRRETISSVGKPISPSQSNYVGSTIVHSFNNPRLKPNSHPGQSMFKLQHAVDLTADAAKDQSEFEFEWQSK